MPESKFALPHDQSTLNRLPHGVAARVVAVDGEGPIARRLLEMGVVPGARVSVLRQAPLGDPLQISVRNYRLALRRTEADSIKVAVDSD